MLQDNDHQLGRGNLMVESPCIWSWDVNTYCLTDSQKYRSDFTQTSISNNFMGMA